MDIEPQANEGLTTLLRDRAGAMQEAYRGILEGSPTPEMQEFFITAVQHVQDYLARIGASPNERPQQWLFLGEQGHELYRPVDGHIVQLGPKFSHLDEIWGKPELKRFGQEAYRTAFRKSGILTGALQQLGFLPPDETLGGLYEHAEVDQIYPKTVQSAGNLVTVDFEGVSGLKSRSYPIFTVEVKMMNTGFDLRGRAYVHLNPQ